MFPLGVFSMRYFNLCILKDDGNIATVSVEDDRLSFSTSTEVVKSDVQYCTLETLCTLFKCFTKGALKLLYTVVYSEYKQAQL